MANQPFPAALLATINIAAGRPWRKGAARLHGDDNGGNEAGLPKRCASHGLRKAAATRAAERGATTTQLMSWFDWRTMGEAARYTQNADRKRAAAALAKLMMGTE